MPAVTPGVVVDADLLKHVPSQTRQQFGVTLGHFQAYKHQLANMAVEVEPLRGLYWYAAHAFDHVEDESERTAAIAKAHVTDVAMQAARDTVEQHGRYSARTTGRRLRTAG